MVLPNIISDIKSVAMNWVVHAAEKRNIKNSYKFNLEEFKVRGQLKLLGEYGMIILNGSLVNRAQECELD